MWQQRGGTKVTLEELATAAEAAQEQAWAAWQHAFRVAQQARALAEGRFSPEKIPLTWNPIRDALKKPQTGKIATATLATSATQEVGSGRTVAIVAAVAVAKPAQGQTTTWRQALGDDLP